MTWRLTSSFRLPTRLRSARQAPPKLTVPIAVQLVFIACNTNCAILCPMHSATLQLAMHKAQALSEAAQEEIGRDVLLRIQELEELRTKIRVGIAALDAGKGGPLDMHEIKAEARRRYGAHP